MSEYRLNEGPGTGASAGDVEPPYGPELKSGLGDALRDQPAETQLVVALGVLEQMREELEQIRRVMTHADEWGAADQISRVAWAAGGTSEVDWRGTFKSVAIINENTFPIYVGFASGRGTQGQSQLIVPAGGFAVLPVRASVVSVGAPTAGAATVIPLLVTFPPFVSAAGVVSMAAGALFDVEGNVAAGAADAGNPVKIGGRFTSAAPALTDGQRGDARLDASGNLRVLAVGAQQSAVDAQTNTVAGMVGPAGVAAFLGIVANYLFNGATWDRVRTPVKFTSLASTAVTAGTGITLWTPAAGKKFRLMGWLLSLSVAGQLIFGDNVIGTVIARSEALAAAGVSKVGPELGNGILSALANNVLKLDVTVTGNVAGMVWGTEE